MTWGRPLRLAEADCEARNRALAAVLPLVSHPIARMRAKRVGRADYNPIGLALHQAVTENA